MAAKLDLTTEDGLKIFLQSGLYPECSRVERLPDGVSGFVYRVWQQEGSQPASFIVKHVQAYAARSQQWKIDQNRMDFEYEALKYLSELTQQPEDIIRVPKPLHYDRKTHVLVMEDAGNVPSLKTWLQAGRDRNIVTKTGEALGRYLAKAHNASAEDTTLKQRFNENATAKYLSGAVFFRNLPATAEKYGYTDSYIQEAARVGQHDVDHSNEVFTLGDYWTGNVLVSDSAELSLFIVDLEFAKPGSSSYDIGQMAAEMYFLATFRDQDLGFALLDAFLSSYRKHRRGCINVAKVAIRVGAHIFVVGPPVWKAEASDELMEEQLRKGADLIRMGVAEDDASLKDSMLRKLYE